VKLSVIGLPQSGVTTVFSALTGRHEDPHAFARPGEPHLAVVAVPDRRVDVLGELYRPKKVTHATVEYVEVPGLFSATGGGATANAEAAAVARDSDACIKVLRNFDDEAAPNPRGPNDPLRDLRDIDDELLTLDLGVIEKRMQRLRKDLTKPVPEHEQLKVELGALERCLAAAEAGRALDEVDFNEQEEKLLRGFRFLTLKPCIHVVNIQESAIGSAAAPKGLPPESSLAFCAKIEDEIEQLEEADRGAFLADLGIEELARDCLIRMSYPLLGLVCFLTVNEDEARAWALKAGSTVIDAAGTIHSDMARGFIKAEVMTFEDLERLGSEPAVKANGLERLEGRDHVVEDGDILRIRFHV